MEEKKWDERDYTGVRKITVNLDDIVITQYESKQKDTHCINGTPAPP